MDEDNADLVLEGVEVSGNRGDGLFIEANQGPIRIERSRIQDNGGFGIKAANTERLALIGNELAENARGALEITGSNSAQVTPMPAPSHAASPKRATRPGPLSMRDGPTCTPAASNARRWTVRRPSVDRSNTWA